MSTHSSILAWKIIWTGEPDELQPMGLQRVGHNRVTNTLIYIYIYIYMCVCVCVCVCVYIYIYLKYTDFYVSIANLFLLGSCLDRERKFL